MSYMMPTAGALVLAAGKGSRMMSSQPKVLHTLLGKSMLLHVIEALEPIFGERIWIVIGHEADMVRKHLAGENVRFIYQEKQLGTGHALQISLPILKAANIEELLLINGDTPLITNDLLEDFLDKAKDSDLSFASLTLSNPGFFGRVLRQNGTVKAIIEAKDYDVSKYGPETGEVNSGLYFMRLKSIAPLLPLLDNANKSGEYYITDIVFLAAKHGLCVKAPNFGDNPGLLGINTPEELKAAEKYLLEHTDNSLQK